MEAMVEACHGGIAPAADRRTRLPVPVVDRRWTRIEGLDVPALDRHAQLTFVTPLRLQVGRVLRGGAAALPFHLVSRAAALARWQGQYLDLDWSAWRDRARAVAVDEAGLRPIAWQRHSRNHPSRPVVQTALAGQLTLIGDLAPFAPVLAVAERAHAGGLATLGLGRFALSPLPF
jgi:hypothetical protein